MENNIKAICAAAPGMLILCQSDELFLWDIAGNRLELIYIEKDQDTHLNLLACSGDNAVMSILGASVVGFEIKEGASGALSAKSRIVSFDELPELTVAVCESDSITVRRSGFCSAAISLESRISCDYILTTQGVYLLNELGHGYFLAPGRTDFQPLEQIGLAVRILKSTAATDGCVYYIDTLYNLCCGQSSFQYSLSSYQFGVLNMRSLARYIFIFGTASGVQATSSAATGHEALSGTLLIFETVRPGVLELRGRQLFSAQLGTPVDVALHAEADQAYIIFNTPHSANKVDLLRVCFGTIDELIAGNGRFMDLNIGRKQSTDPSTACAADSYLVSYQGYVFSYSALTLEYQSAVAVDSSFGRLQASQSNSTHALALSGNLNEVRRITPNTSNPYYDF